MSVSLAVQKVDVAGRARCAPAQANRWYALHRRRQLRDIVPASYRRPPASLADAGCARSRAIAQTPRAGPMRQRHERIAPADRVDEVRHQSGS